MATNAHTTTPGKPETGQAMHGMEQAVDEAKSALSAGVHTAQQKVEETLGKARETAAHVAASVSDAASYVGERAESATGAVGGALESTGHYLKEDGLHHIAEDVSNIIRRNPGPALLAGIGLGYLIAQACNRRSA